MNEYPSYIEVSDHFYHDAKDLLARFKASFDGESITFSTVKSRRMKCYVNLRMAMEAVLKSYCSYYCHTGICGKKLVQKVENYRHHLIKAFNNCEKYLPKEKASKCKDVCEKMGDLPVGLRYKLDVMDFISVNNELYYSTIGSDDWITNLSDLISELITEIGSALSKESKLINGEELWEKYKRPRYSRYSEKNA